MDSLQNAGEISDISDLDNVDEVANGISGLNLGGDHSAKDKEVVEIPDLDDISDMESSGRITHPSTYLLGHIFQDISADHAHKTVTIEPFIHSTSLQAASVHPCKHASVVKTVIERMNSSVVAEQLAHQQKAEGSTKEGKKKWSVFGGGGKSSAPKKDKSTGTGGDEQVEGMRVDLYLVVFLKCIASIVPTIEVASTTSF